MAPTPVASILFDSTQYSPTPQSVPSTSPYSSSDDLGVGDDAQSPGSTKGVGIAIAIAILVCFLVMFTTITFFCLHRRRQIKKTQQAEARLIRRSQIEDAPPPYIRHSQAGSMQTHKDSALPPPPGAVIEGKESSWDTLPVQPTTTYWPRR